MSARQQWVTAVMGLLMVATIMAMPAHDPRQGASQTRHGGSIAAAPENRAETPQDQLRDLAYN